MEKLIKQSYEKILKQKVIKQSLYTVDGVLLISENIEVTDSILDLLHNLQSADFDIYIKINYDDSKLKFDDVIKLDTEIKARTVQTLDYMFNSSNTDESIEAANLLAQDLSSTIGSSDSVSLSLAELKCSDEYTFKHSLDVAAMATLVGKALGLGKKELTDLSLAGLLHDIGKKNISNQLLNKQGKLTDEESAIMKKHPVYSYQLIKDIDTIPEVVKVACLQHHEKWNGSGYPLNVEEYNINYYARILTVVDVFDALVTDRPYHKHYTPSDAIEIMNSMIGQFDLNIYKTFLKTIVLYPVGTIIKLSNGENAIVIRNREENILRPTVRLLETNKVLNLLDDLKTYNITILGEVDDDNVAKQENDLMLEQNK